MLNFLLSVCSESKMKVTRFPGISFLWIIFLSHQCFARDICTQSAVLQQTGIVQTSRTKSLPIAADVTSQLEVLQDLGEFLYYCNHCCICSPPFILTENKNEMMKIIKEDLLEEVDYSPSLIYNNVVIKAIDSTLPNAREHCSDLGQGNFTKILPPCWAVFYCFVL